MKKYKYIKMFKVKSDIRLSDINVLMALARFYPKLEFDVVEKEVEEKERGK